ncbi:MAG: hypothetical protein KF678_06585 [Phycisphaeraceae bacterium]|nr:hypothetical protein [Phycisphaeraceae bacterium]
MSRITSTLRSLMVAAAIATSIVFGALTARADTLTLKDGRTLEGEVARELNGYIWFKYKVGGLETTQMFSPAEITKLERTTGTPAKTDTPAAKPSDQTRPSDPAKPSTRPAPGTSAKLSSAPRAAVITLGEGGDKDMVGLYMTADAIERAIPLLEKEKVEIVVFRINSGGGALLEIQKLSDVIELKYKPKFRVVAWIESAISAAAMTAHCIEEIYFMPKGNYGACTGWSGQLVAVKGRQLEEVLYMMERISARGKHDPKIMRSMQIMDPLSCNIDENGDVQWFQNDSGTFLVNPKDRILTFNSETASKYKFSRGTASTIEELGKLMGYTELVWVGKEVPGVPYPICEAEELQRQFRAKTYMDTLRLREYWDTYQTNVGVARSVPFEERGKFVARARGALDNIKRMVKNNPNLALFQFNMLEEQFKEWVEEREEELRRLTRR